MAYDLAIRNGEVIDGLPRYRGDVGVRQGRIAFIGRIRESAPEVIDAEGRVVSRASSTAERTWTPRPSGGAAGGHIIIWAE